MLNAVNDQLCARIEAAEVLLLIFGEDPEIHSMTDWALYDPHHEHDGGVAAIEAETRALREFTHALYDHMTWESPGGRW